MNDEEAMMSMEPLLSSKEVAEMLGMSRRTLDRRRKNGEIRWRKIGGRVKYHPRDVEDYLNQASRTGIDEKEEKPADVALHETEAREEEDEEEEEWDEDDEWEWDEDDEEEWEED